MIPSKHDRPEGWLQRIFLEATARVRLWPAWKKRAIRKPYDELMAGGVAALRTGTRTANEVRFSGITWRGCNSGLDELDQQEVRDSRPSTLECCGKTPSECTCLYDLNRVYDESGFSSGAGIAPIRVSLEMLEDSRFDLAAMVRYALCRDLQHESALSYFGGI